MPAFSSSAPGKIILFGEHAVVYGRPAVAVPVTEVSAKVTLTPNPRGQPGELKISAPEIGLEAMLADLPAENPLARAIRLTASALKVSHIPAAGLRIKSNIPVASGLGSGAAVTVALMRSLSAFLGQTLPDERVSALAYEVEKIHHGTPSGIDNAVITYACPVYFIKNKPLVRLKPGRPFTIIIGDTGIASPTAVAVGDVRKAWQAAHDHYEALFDSAGAMADSARKAIENGNIELIGPLMDANHGLLRKIGVSCSELDRLVLAARDAGAWGAKLSGGGRGGNMIALASPDRADKIARSLLEAGAARVIVTDVS